MKCMKRLTLIICVLSFLSIAFQSCKKYPENDRVYLESAKRRLRTHPWYFNKLYINGADSTLEHLHKFILSNETSDFYFKVTDGLDYNHNSGKFNVPFTAKGIYPALESDVELKNEKKIMRFSPIFYSPTLTYISNPSTSNSLFWIPENDDWTIKKLTKTDLIIQTNYNNYEVRFEFKDK